MWVLACNIVWLVMSVQVTFIEIFLPVKSQSMKTKCLSDCASFWTNLHNFFAVLGKPESTMAKIKKKSLLRYHEY